MPLKSNIPILLLVGLVVFFVLGFGDLIVSQKPIRQPLALGFDSGFLFLGIARHPAAVNILLHGSGIEDTMESHLVAAYRDMNRSKIEEYSQNTVAFIIGSQYIF